MKDPGILAIGYVHIIMKAPGILAIGYVQKLKVSESEWSNQTRGFN